MLMPQCDRILSPELRQEATEGVALRVFDFYMRFHGAVCDPKNKYESPETIAPRPPQEVRALLAV